MIIQIVNKQRTLPESDIVCLNQCVETVFAQLESGGVLDSELLTADGVLSVSLTYTGESYIRQMNRDHRDVDKVTDVLSFPLLSMRDGKLTEKLGVFDFSVDDEGRRVLELGDILLCLKRAERQASEYGHLLEREIAFLALHGLLHLLGYDHIEAADEKVMLDVQKGILDAAGFSRDVSDPGSSVSKKKSVAAELASVGKFVPEEILPHTGYVAVLGRPNVGKSTLINYLSGMKVAIVTPKPQTTRTRIRSVINQKDAQIIFLDTPGIHKPKNALSTYMVETAFRAAEDGDVILFLVDAAKGRPTFVEKEICKLAESSKKMIVLALNKADAVVKEELLPLIATYHSLYPFEDIIPISAKTGDGLEELLALLVSLLPSGPRFYQDEETTDQSERMLAAEFIREQLLRHLSDEIPYGTAVEIENFEDVYAEDAKDEYDRKMVKIKAAVYCDKTSHKGIVLGKKGHMIKTIGTKARENIEKMCGCKVYLELFVKVRDDWKNKDVYLKELGYHKDS